MSSTSGRYGHARLVRDRAALATSHGPGNVSPIEVARRGLRMPADSTDAEVLAACAQRRGEAAAEPTDAQLVARLDARDRALCAEYNTPLATYARLKHRRDTAQAAAAARKSASLATARANLRAQADGLLRAAGVTQVRRIWGGQ